MATAQFLKTSCLPMISTCPHVISAVVKVHGISDFCNYVRSTINVGMPFLVLRRIARGIVQVRLWRKRSVLFRLSVYSRRIFYKAI
jgi:hypothetical protein